ncbi:MAG TPA: phenylalanine--tRNA ligase subunit beta [Bacteroidales bacterium]|nr:phenylalanine--tRNA ligase subunit beta [Bacteroidales bacterium]HRW27198.1 phenylalanine--tRNA ligase subunit beta [Bacteroidales bacterium]
MKISYNWLREYLDFDAGPEELSVILTSLGLEVEGMEEWVSVRGGMKGVVVGKVLICEKHPDADRLSVTTVDAGGTDPLHIVCGAPNVAAGQLVAVALPGTMVYHGNEQFEIKRSKIRGQLSEGMICAEDELGIGDDHEGIMVLDSSARVGMPAAEYFGVTTDTVFEIGLTPNMIDCSSHFGVARDLAAYFNLQKPVRARLPEITSIDKESDTGAISITVEAPEACIRYSGLTIRGIKVGPSPAWLQTRLRAIGLHPINNVVDITNFVLHETGQPLHAFDVAAIKGGTVRVRHLPDKTRFVTLDGVERTLASTDLMICNQEEGMCIAGVFGGLHSGVSESTTDLFLESATFSPVSVRRTSRRHDLRTDASYRFERGTDPEMTIYALKRAAMLVRELAGGTVTGDIIDVYPAPVRKAVVRYSLDRMTRLIGKEIPVETVKTILYSLDINITAEEEGILTLEIPTYRVDVTREADVTEEVLRIYGYDNIGISNEMHTMLSHTDKPDREKMAASLSEMLSANGFVEIMCNSLSPAAWFETTGDFEVKDLVRLANPLSSDLNVMRLSLLPGMLNAIAWNINRQSSNLRLFELGYIYRRKGRVNTLEITDNFAENQVLAMALTGNMNDKRWNAPETPSGFFHLKGYAEMVLSRFGITRREMVATEVQGGWFAEGIQYTAGGLDVASFGKVSRKYLSMFDIRQDVFYAEIVWENLIRLTGTRAIRFSELPRYPWVRRDLALLVDRSVKFSQIHDLAFRTERNILQEVDLFDVYESETIGRDKKSYAVSFILRDERQTLTEKNIEKTMGALVKAFEREFGATLR